MWHWIVAYWAWILIFCGGLIGLLFGWIADDQKDVKKATKAKWFTRIGLLAVIIGGGASGYQSISSEAEKNRIQAEHAAEEKRILEENLILSKQVSSLQQESLDHFTGGDSIFHFHFIERASGAPWAQYMVEGTHPVPEPFVQIENITKALKLRSDGVPEDEIKSKITTRRQLETVWPVTALGMRKFPFPESGNGLFVIIIQQPKDMYVQVMGMRRLEDGSHIFAYRIFKVVERIGYKKILEPAPIPAYFDPRFSANDRFLEAISNPALLITNYVVKKLSTTQSDGDN